jgi:hypothetical protein
MTKMYVPPTSQIYIAMKLESFRERRISTLLTPHRGVPIIVVLGIGYGITAIRDAQQRIQLESMQEEERLRRNAQLMDAYGDKTSLEDMQRALEQYHKVSILPFPPLVGPRVPS